MSACRRPRLGFAAAGARISTGGLEAPPRGDRIPYVIGHGVIISALKARVRRREPHLNRPSL
jgi:hypothetical protein